ncbi:DUF5071 domain-containing protein [Paenibacillus tritici]|nr:DUF5071 domain-containing protein [Paenibacillus tritici]
MKQLQDIHEDELHLLLQSLTKGHWDGAAEVIIKLGYPRIERILPGLLVWIQDINWPGAGLIADFLREIGDPVIPYIQDVFNQHSDDEEWIGWIFEGIIDHWNTNLISQIQEELIRLSTGGYSGLKSLRTLLVHRIYPKDAVELILQDKKKKTLLEIMELDASNPGIDCEALQRGFREQAKTGLNRSYIEQNEEKYLFCNRKSSLQNFLSEIEELESEVSGFN